MKSLNYKGLLPTVIIIAIIVVISFLATSCSSYKRVIIYDVQPIDMYASHPVYYYTVRDINKYYTIGEFDYYESAVLYNKYDTIIITQ